MAAGRLPEIPGYEDLTVVGHGGFATVYRAHETAFNRDVAIKVLDVEDVSDDARKRFERECRAVGSLSGHPGIVTVFGAGSATDGRPFIAMEFMDHGSLGLALKRGQVLTPTQTVAVGREVLDAVGAAHEIGIVHRDIKPDNILISRYNRHQLADFGISSMPGAYETRSGTAAATMGFAAPEVIDGNKATAASDLYSVGATMATLMLGRPIFAREGGDDSIVAYITRILRDAPPDLTAAGASPQLDAVIQRSLAKRPEERYATAAEFSEALATTPEAHGGAGPVGTTAAAGAAASAAASGPITLDHTRPTRSPAPSAAPAAPVVARTGIPGPDEATIRPGNRSPRPDQSRFASERTMGLGPSAAQPRGDIDPEVAEHATVRKYYAPKRVAAPTAEAPSRKRLYLGLGAAAAVVVAGGVTAAVLLTHKSPAPAPVVTPAAAPTLTPKCVGTTCTFTVTGGAASASYVWSFGDSQSSTGSATVKHTYARTGTYAVTLTAPGGGAVPKPISVALKSLKQTLRLSAGPGGGLTLQGSGSIPKGCATTVALQHQAGGWSTVRQVKLTGHDTDLSVGQAGTYRLFAKATPVANGECVEAASAPVTVAPAYTPPPAVTSSGSSGSSGSSTTTSSGGSTGSGSTSTSSGGTTTKKPVNPTHLTHPLKPLG